MQMYIMSLFEKTNKIIDQTSSQLFSKYGTGRRNTTDITYVIEDTIRSASFYYGLSGLAYMEADMFYLTKSLKHKSRANKYIRLAYDALKKTNQLDNGFITGVGGVAWASMRLNEVGIKSQTAPILELFLDTKTGKMAFDIASGSAGRGLVMLRAYRLTSNRIYYNEAKKEAKFLIKKIPQIRKNNTYWGFAHGISGVGYFLLELYITSKDEVYKKFCIEISRTLCREARANKNSAFWEFGPASNNTWPYWCHGASGIGIFLTRLHNSMGGYSQIIKLASKGVVYGLRPTNNYGICHGIAGIGNFLLEAQAALNKPVGGVEAILKLISLDISIRGKNIFWPAQENGDISDGFMNGYPGLVHFLARCIDMSIPHPTLLPLFDLNMRL